MDVPGSSQVPKEKAFDPYTQPPKDMKEIFKKWKKIKNTDSSPQESNILSGDWFISQARSKDKCSAIFQSFAGEQVIRGVPKAVEINCYHTKCYESKIIPGLKVVPHFLPISCQTILLDRLLSRDLANPAHNTNLNLHYKIAYPAPGKSFLDFDREHAPFLAKNPDIHQNLTMDRVLTDKLRWMTLGGQYDWTRKEYPHQKPPEFPSDIYDLLHGSFPDMKPQAAIVNFYSPGDTLSLHRDVSEEVDRGLVSISIGCDAIFIIGLSDDDGGNSRFHVLRLKSGDALYMSGESRYAWHGVPSIVPNTCPKELENWPGSSYPIWKDYMKTKRINLNARQMFEADANDDTSPPIQSVQLSHLQDLPSQALDISGACFR